MGFSVQHPHFLLVVTELHYTLGEPPPHLLYIAPKKIDFPSTFMGWSFGHKLVSVRYPLATVLGSGLCVYLKMGQSQGLVRFVFELQGKSILSPQDSQCRGKAGGHLASLRGHPIWELDLPKGSDAEEWQGKDRVQ